MKIEGFRTFIMQRVVKSIKYFQLDKKFMEAKDTDSFTSDVCFFKWFRVSRRHEAKVWTVAQNWGHSYSEGHQFCQKAWLRKERKKCGGIDGEKHGQAFFFLIGV